MHVLVTGCTGFVGFHTALALHAAGHQVRLGVRNPDKMRRVFAGYNIPLDDFSVGEVINRTAVNQSLDGVDGVVHCAAMVNLESRMADVVRETNVVGTRNVIGRAIELGLQSIVYVSSVSALFNPELEQINEASPLTEATNGYARSKKEADEYIREQINRGANISITYPTGIVGPDDPGLSESNAAIAMLLNNRFINTEGGMQHIDVRDLAQVHVRLLEEQCSGLFVAGGHYSPWEYYTQAFERILGRSVPQSTIPGSVLRGVGRSVDLLRRVLPLPAIISLEAMQYATRSPIANDLKLRQTLDYSYRSLHSTLADTVRWLAKAGHIDAGLLLDTPLDPRKN